MNGRVRRGQSEAFHQTASWQVSGKNHMPFERLKRLDVHDASTVSFWHDLLLVLRTPLAPITQLWQVVMERLALKTQTQAKDVTTKGMRA